MSSAYPPYGEFVKQQQTVQLPSDVASVLARVFEEHRMMLGAFKTMSERMAHLEWFSQNFESRLQALETSKPIVPYPSAPPYSSAPPQQQPFQNRPPGYY